VKVAQFNSSESVPALDIEQLTGRYSRLRKELAAAYGSVPWNTRHIDRLTNEMATTERELAEATAGHFRIAEPTSIVRAVGRLAETSSQERPSQAAAAGTGIGTLLGLCLAHVTTLLTR
jgi:hypothetical protein